MSWRNGVIVAFGAALVACGGGNADGNGTAPGGENSGLGNIQPATGVTFDPTSGADANSSTLAAASSAASAAALAAAATTFTTLAKKTAGIPAAVATGFGITASDTALTVASGAGLVFDVSLSNGNITSIHYNQGPELQLQTAGSHIASGLGPDTVVTYDISGNVAKVTLTTPTLTHYLMVRSGENNIYMGTYVTAEPPVGELRWITRLNGSVFTNVPAESNLRGNTGAIESKDIFGMADGSTRSKYYGNQRAIDYTLRGVTGNGVGVFMAYGNRETSSGGPFYRDIQNQSDGATEVYNYMNSGHSQIEAWRMGFHGPYALMFTDGSTPTATPDMSWMGDYGVTGWVGPAARGRVIGNGLKGRDTSIPYTVAFANDTAQYWTTATPATGSFGSYNMKPGDYTMTVYKGELAVYSEAVSVIAGGATTVHTRTITADPAADAAVWRIGTWDGTPNEFRNGTSINLRHPSDTRNASWGPLTYAVGGATSLFPAVQWKSVNNPTTVTFNLTAEQIAAHTLRIGITDAYAGGRPSIQVNAWSPAQTPPASNQPDSRTFTTGSFRGNNTLYSYDIPASAFKVGNNTLTINVSSGSNGTTFLSPAYSFDALDLL